MDDLKYGKRNKRGDWAPSANLEIAPFYSFPPNLAKLGKWLVGYFLPYNLLFGLSALAFWAWIIPPMETMKTYAWGWALWLYMVNALSIMAFYAIFEFRLYISRAQATRFKYNGKFPSEHPSEAFWFKSQNIDNFLRCFLSGVPCMTLIEVFSLHAYANSSVQWVSFATNPIYLLVLAFIVPLFHEGYFYCIHRLIHTPFLYKWVHSVHHNSVNPSPWSSLSMHPVEAAAYFGVALVHLLIPSNPVLMLYQLHFAGFGAIVGHIGFDTIEVGKDGGFDSHAYAHYLHHKYFEVNYGDGSVPLDKLFGTWHDGSAEGDALMQARYEKQKARANAAAK